MSGRLHLYYTPTTVAKIMEIAAAKGIKDSIFAISHVNEMAILLLFEGIKTGEITDKVLSFYLSRVEHKLREKLKFEIPEPVPDINNPADTWEPDDGGFSHTLKLPEKEVPCAEEDCPVPAVIEFQSEMYCLGHAVGAAKERGIKIEGLDPDEFASKWVADNEKDKVEEADTAAS